MEIMTIVSLAIYSLVFVLGVLGNGVVIWVTGFKMKKTINTIWYLNLAVADFLITAFLPLRITKTALDNHWPFGKFMCKMDGVVFVMNMCASIYTLVVISVDRCVCVVGPVWAKNHRSVRKASWVSLGVWLLALALSSTQLIFRDSETSDFKVQCYFVLIDDNSTAEVKQLRAFQYGALIIATFLMGFVVPFAVIVSCYSVIIHRLRNNRSLASQKGRSFKIMAAVIAAFFLCWAPFHIMFLVTVLTTESSKTLYGVFVFWFPMAYGLALLNSCLNPLLYMFMGQDFKEVFHSRRSVLKVLEKAFDEELPQSQTNASTKPGTSSLETALHDTQV